MQLPNGDPRKRVLRDVTWARIKWEKGQSKSVNGWLAGPVKWVLCHHKSVSLPCCHELTNGAVSCPLCLTHPDLYWIGYVPLYDEPGKCVFTQIREYSLDIMARIAVYDAIRVMRGADQFDSVTISPSKWAGPYRPTSDARREPAKMDSFLLRLWGIESLIRHFTQVPGGDIRQTYQRAVETRTDADDASRKLLEKIRERIVYKEKTGDDNIATLGDVLPPPGAVPTPGRNGKHHHNKNGDAG